MILSIILRHFKSHKNINFIPISNGENLTGILGENGIGKSAILEALETYFNADKNWNINQQAKKEGGISGDDKTPFIAPLIIWIAQKFLTSRKKNLLMQSVNFFGKFLQHLAPLKAKNSKST